MKLAAKGEYRSTFERGRFEKVNSSVTNADIRWGSLNIMGLTVVKLIFAHHFASLLYRECSHYSSVEGRRWLGRSSSKTEVTVAWTLGHVPLAAGDASDHNMMMMSHHCHHELECRTGATATLFVLVYILCLQLNHLKWGVSLHCMAS